MRSSLIKSSRHSWFDTIFLCLAIVTVSGCSSLSDWHHSRKQASSYVPAPTDRFLLPPEGVDIVGNVQVTAARHEDTLLDIARRYDLGYEEIIAANPGVDPWLPGKDTNVVLPTQFILPGQEREGLVLNLASMRLFYFPKPEPGQPAEVITHPIGIGREGWRTPQGTTRITQKIEKPAWTVPESVRREHVRQGDPLPQIVPPGPDNPLGEFAMRLSRPQYLIHGTNKPWGVGIRVSHGCVRLYPEDISRLFPQVPVGTPVRIINEPYVVGRHDGLLYLEAHAPLSEDARRWKGSLEPMQKAVETKAADFTVEVNWQKARKIAGQARGIPLPVGPGSPDLAEILVKAPQVPSTPPWAPLNYEQENTLKPAPPEDKRVDNEDGFPPS
ncbi:MAG: L,D-transpeptidase family protein [Thiogranum sp.]